jgi:hypothetical protein
MTAAYTSSEAAVARPAATSARMPALVVPAALAPAFIPVCFALGGLCETLSACAAQNGTPATQLPRSGCSAGTVCCILDF